MTIFCREVDNETLEEEADNQTIEGLSVEQEGIVENIHVTEDDYGLFWENGPHYYPYYDHISDGD